MQVDGNEVKNSHLRHNKSILTKGAIKMSIKAIKVEYFTVFKNMEVEITPGINIFIGENGTGKTHLLKLVYAANTIYSTNYMYNIHDLFGNKFRLGGCRFVINGDDSHTWTLAGTSTPSQTTLHPTKSYVHVDIDAKTSTVFIPAKEFLSMPNIIWVAEEYKNSLNLDVTITDIIKKAQNMIPDSISEFALSIAHKIENLIDGKVFFDEKDKTFWIHKNNGDKFPFTSEAEGFRKWGLLWQLIMNKSITKGSVLLWDEPEANLSRIDTSSLVDILLELSRHDVQIFLATHDYNLMKYFSIKTKPNDNVMFHSLYKTEDGVACESDVDYDLLEHNAIIDANTKLLEDDIEGVL